jgi:hypothetical protein
LRAETEAAEARQHPPAGNLSATEGVGDRFKSTATIGSSTADEQTAEEQIEEVLREAARSPKLALMLLSNKIRRANREHSKIMEYRTSDGSVIPLRGTTFEVAKALISFNQVCNLIVQSRDTNEEEVVRALDSGARLLTLILSKPRVPPEFQFES